MRYYKQSYKATDERAIVLANTGNFKIAAWYQDHQIQKVFILSVVTIMIV